MYFIVLTFLTFRQLDLHLCGITSAKVQIMSFWNAMLCTTQCFEALVPHLQGQAEDEGTTGFQITGTEYYSALAVRTSHLAQIIRHI